MKYYKVQFRLVLPTDCLVHKKLGGICIVVPFDAWSDEDKDGTKPVEDDDTENNSSSDNNGEDEISNPVTYR
jgi:hypothetical protein